MSYVSRNPAQGRGAYRDRHNAGQAAVDAGHIGAKGLQGGKPWARPSRARPVWSAYGKIVWSWRPESVRQVLWWCVWPNRALTSVIREATGAIVHRSPGRSRH